MAQLTDKQLKDLIFNILMVERKNARSREKSELRVVDARFVDFSFFTFS